MIQKANKNKAAILSARLPAAEKPSAAKNIEYTATIKELQKDLRAIAKDCMRAQRGLLRQKSFVNQLFDNSPQAIAVISAKGYVVNYNRSFSKLFGFTPDPSSSDKSIETIVPQELMEEHWTILETAKLGETVYKETYRLNAAGQIIHVALVFYPVKNGKNIEEIICEYRDVSEKKQFEKHLYNQTFYDPLTKLPGRILFMERLEQALKKFQRNKIFPYAVQTVGLDKIRTFTDSYGHQYGDKLLVDVADKFKTCIRSSDTLARLGKNEFGVLVEGFESVNEVISITRRLNHVCSKPLTIDDKVIHTSASIGIVLNTEIYKGAEEILRDSEMAMYRIKESGGDGFRVFNKEMHDIAIESLEIENDLRLAIKNKELLLHFQPIMSGDGLKPKGFEALLRWDHPTKGMIYPDKFISIAEESGLILPMGKYVIEQAILQIKEWEEYFIKHSLSISVNVSVKQVLKEDFGQMITSLIQKHNIKPDFLQIEVTESVLMEDTEFAIQQLGQVRDAGVKLVIDDFGTGYSSLSYLRKFPTDTLKIDKSFIDELGKNNIDSEIVKTIINLAKNLRISVVAEGVEDENQLSHLQDLSCDYVQGYLFSKPVEKNRAFEMLQAI